MAKKTEAYQAKLRIDKLYIKGIIYTIKSLHQLPAALKPENVFTPQNDNQVAFFHGESPLSNFHPAKFSISGSEYNCCEQYIQSQKALVFGDQGTADLIMNATTASQQKSLSYKIANFSRTVWEESAVKIVSTGVKAKFEQNDKCKVFLLSTKNKK